MRQQLKIFFARFTTFHGTLILVIEVHLIVSCFEDVPTKEGMDVHLEAAALINLRKDSAVELYKTVGSEYLDTVVVPQFRSVLRSISSMFKF